VQMRLSSKEYEKYKLGNGGYQMYLQRLEIQRAREPSCLRQRQKQECE
jgi:hypothetical protein